MTNSLSAAEIGTYFWLALSSCLAFGQNRFSASDERRNCTQRETVSSACKKIQSHSAWRHSISLQMGRHVDSAHHFRNSADTGKPWPNNLHLLRELTNLWYKASNVVASGGEPTCALFEVCGGPLNRGGDIALAAPLRPLQPTQALE